MATKEIEALLLSHTEFAKRSATDQRNRLVSYYVGWFASGYRIHTIDNIRATQRLSVHAKLMNAPVGAVLLAILEEAAGAHRVSPGTHGLLDVDAGPADYPDEDETPPAEDTTIEDETPPPTPDCSKARPQRDK